MSYQKLIFVGNLGVDPESRFTPQGSQVTSFSVAVNRKYNDSSGEKREVTTWFRVSCWNRLAETTAQYLQQGSRVLVEGRLKPDPDTGGPRVYQRNDGSMGASFEVTAMRVVFLGKTKDVQQEAEKYVPAPEAEDDSIPF